MILVALLVAGAILAAVLTQRSTPLPGPTPPPQDQVRDDPRKTFETPFLNVRPEVRYVGDAACAGCHGDMSEQYHKHPMGRSLEPLAPLPGRVSARTGTFEAVNLRYEAKAIDRRMVHRSTALRPEGSVLAERSASIDFAIGSGGRGHSYLFAEDGYLFQSPISWYGSRRSLDLSPGYRERNAHFDRPVDANCLFCHANYAEAIDGTINRYREPIFAGHAIGCERCHGPGELHVRQPGAMGGIDYTIVNPKHLEPALREAVCQQCHLQGQARVIRAGRGVFDYRPGLPLELFIDTFVWHAGVPHGQKAVGHVEQMMESVCFTRSAGKLGCASCHDPHEKPRADRAAEHYRERCLNCHTEAGCAVQVAKRRHTNGDACAACHMPRAAASDIVHVSVTDHRILREPTREQSRRAAPPAPGEPPLVPFHAGSRFIDRDNLERDLALGLTHLAGQTPPGAQRAYLADLAVARLGDRPRIASDLPAQLALAVALRNTGRPADALAVLQLLLDRSPRHEQALVEAATAARELSKLAEAGAYWRRAIEISPHRWNYHFQLAAALAETGDWKGSLAACSQARLLHPVHIDERVLEVRCLIEVGRRDEAKRAFAEVLELKPPHVEQLKVWFRKQLDR